MLFSYLPGVRPEKRSVTWMHTEGNQSNAKDGRSRVSRMCMCCLAMYAFSCIFPFLRLRFHIYVPVLRCLCSYLCAPAVSLLRCDKCLYTPGKVSEVATKETRMTRIGKERLVTLMLCRHQVNKCLCLHAYSHICIPGERSEWTLYLRFVDQIKCHEEYQGQPRNEMSESIPYTLQWTVNSSIRKKVVLRKGQIPRQSEMKTGKSSTYMREEDKPTINFPLWMSHDSASFESKEKGMQGKE